MINKIFSRRKILLGALISLLILPFFVRPALAYLGTEYPSYQFQFEEAIKSPEMNLQSFVNETLKAVGGSIIHAIGGRLNCTEIEECLTGSQSQGLIPGSLMLMAGIYASPPASGIQYFADLGGKMGITKPVYAQNQTSSFGFNAMKVTQPIWTVFRNLTYVLFALILVAMGFAIMFRVKISPQAVITIQSALPKIVIALVLITFSYAIVGLMIDVAVFLNGLIGGIFEKLFTDKAGTLGFINTLLMRGVQAVTAALTPKALEPLMRPFATAWAYSIVINLLFNAFMFGSIFLTALAPTAVIGIVGFLLGLIIVILLLIAYLRALWTLLKAFAMIVVNLIFAPLRILIGVFPGSNAIGGWFKDVAANIAVLPTMLTLFFIGNYLILAGLEGAGGAFLGGGGMTYGLFWIASALLFPLIGIMILLLIPKVSDMIQSFITKKPFAFGTAIGETLTAPGRGIAQGVRVFNVGLETARRWQERPDWMKRVAPKTRSGKEDSYPGTPGTPASPGEETSV